MMLDPQTHEGLYAFAYTMFETSKIDVALKAFRVLVRFAPSDERSWLGLGACHEKLAQNEVAAELYGAGGLVSSPPSVRCHVAAARIVEDRALASEHLARASAIAESLDDDSLIALVAAERGRT